MKKTLLALTLVLILGVAIAYAQQPGMMGGQQGWYCPNCGQWMGPGMMGGGMMGRGMMGPMMGGQGMMGGGMMGGGMMGGQGMMGPGYGQQYQQPQYQQPQKPLDEKDAKTILENYLTNMRNPNLKLGQIKDAGTVFEAEIVTKDNSVVDKIMIDKATGWMRSAY
jgi:hypothetical protein